MTKAIPTSEFTTMQWKAAMNDIDNEKGFEDVEPLEERKDQRIELRASPT
jgi:hypothetical protein